MMRSLLARGASVAVARPRRTTEYSPARTRQPDAAAASAAGQIPEQVATQLAALTAALNQCMAEAALAKTRGDDLQAQLDATAAELAGTRARLEVMIERTVQIQEQAGSMKQLKQMETDIKNAVDNAIARLPKPQAPRDLPTYDMVVTARDGNNRALKVRLQPAQEES